YTFLFSLAIELTQPLLHMHRASDITDLITNTIGGIIGYLFYRFFSKIKPH
ncbi:MAG: VanZ family protein, partial [Clostridiaceae bacterium]|nr:VanZ family protein [Clostridiaceae bacterium]